MAAKMVGPCGHGYLIDTCLISRVARDCLRAYFCTRTYVWCVRASVRMRMCVYVRTCTGMGTGAVRGCVHVRVGVWCMRLHTGV